MDAFSIVTLILYVSILFILSAFLVKRALNSYEEYILCGRALTIWYVIFTYLGTWIGGGTIIGLAGISYEDGVSRYWLFAASCIVSFVFAFLFITRIRKLHLNSIADMFALRYPEYGEAIRIPVAAGLIVRNVTMTGMQFTALSYMLTYIFNIDRNIAVLATFVIITGYTALSGSWGVVATDIFQGLLQTIGLFMILYLCIKVCGGFSGAMAFFSSSDQQRLLSITGGDGISWLKDVVIYIFSFGLFFLMGDESDWERIYAAKTDKTAFWGFLIPVTITMLILLSPAYIGVFQRAVDTAVIDPDFIIYRFLFQMVKPAMAAFITVTLFSAIMSSADSYMFATGVIFSNDIIKRFLNKDAEDREMIFWTRWAVIVSGAISFAFAINIHDIIYLWITGLALPAIIILPAYLYAWFSKRVNTRGALAGIASASLYCAAILFCGIKISVGLISLGIASNMAITYAASLLFRDKALGVENTHYSSKAFESTKNIPS